MNTTMSNIPPPLLTILMAVAMRQYNTARIARWKRFVAFIKATKHHRRASTSRQRRLFRTSHREKGLQSPVDMLAPNNNRGMTYQTDEKHLTIFPEHFVGVVKLAIYC